MTMHNNKGILEFIELIMEEEFSTVMDIDETYGIIKIW